MKVLRTYYRSLTIVMVLAFFSMDAQAITVVNNSLSGPDTDILCRNNPHPSLVQNCWTAGTSDSYNFKISNPGNKELLADDAFGSILGDLTMLYKAESFEDVTLDPPIRSTPAGEEGSLQNSYMTAFDFALNEIDDGYTGATIKRQGGPSVDCSVDCFLVIKDGNHNPAAYLFNLALGWDPLGRNGGQPVANGIPAWDGLMDLTLANFWNDTGGSISYIAIYGNTKISSVPAPAALWLFGTALLGFIGISRSTRV
jgi:hypothetical protein